MSDVEVVIRRLGWCFFAVSLVVVVVLSLEPQVPFVSAMNVSDKSLHLLAYLVLCFFSCFSFYESRLSLKSVLLPLAVCLSIGLAVEVIQPFFSRSMEWMDFISEIVGCLLGLAMARLLLAIVVPKSGR
ncbi:MAG: VanZ family protein [Sphaerochaetaceae bacterium]|jgi:VanZ family protein|nr:VanZ family protein [Sphaerochaetaceae bacterium]